MKEYEEKLLSYIRIQNITAKHLTFEESCHTVLEAAQAAGTTPDHLVKNICFIDDSNNIVVAIVKGEDRVSTKKIKDILNLSSLSVASQEEILEKTGYPCGGVPSFGYEAKFIVDSRVLEKDEIFTGGGSSKSLVKISPSELIKANKGLLGKIRK